MQRKSLLIVVVSLAFVMGSALAAAAQVPPPARTFAAAPSSQALTPPYALGTAITYQGQLKSGGTPVNGACDIGFHLYDDPAAGNEIGTPLTPTITATNGIFTTLLDFGAGAFTGDARWLEMRVRCPHGAGSFITLAPREALTPAPMALALPGLWTQQNPFSPNLIGGFSGNVISPVVTGVVIGGGGNLNNINRVPFGGDYSVIGGGLNNIAGGSASTIGGGGTNRTVGTYSTVTGGLGNYAGGGYSVAGGFENTAGGLGAVVSGGGNNTASGLDGVVAGGDTNNAGVDDTAISGGQNNAITGTSHHAYIGGGQSNVVGYNSDHSTIGGGQDNSIVLPNAFQSVIAGGQGNIITGSWGTIGGGLSNSASDSDATVSGGDHNRAEGHDATVSGGGTNVATGTYATIPGGVFNIAQGAGSFAAGQNAQALHDGAFVWADGSGGVFASNGTNKFMVRAHGGVYFDDGGGSCTLPAGGNAWSCSSDRALKTNFAAADGKDVLARLVTMPISFWSMKSQDPSVRHIGPVAQDFSAAFKVGEDNTHIGLLDEGGVALAAIQGLNQLVQAQQAEIGALKDERAAQQRQFAALDARVSAQDARLSALEQAAGANSPAARASDTFYALGLLVLGMLSGAAALLLFQRRSIIARK